MDVIEKTKEGPFGWWGGGGARIPGGGEGEAVEAAGKGFSALHTSP